MSKTNKKITTQMVWSNNLFGLKKVYSFSNIRHIKGFLGMRTLQRRQNEKCT